MVDPKDVARKFAAVLEAWLSPQDFAELRRRNAAETDANICHSHDFCDANMAMDAALRACGVDNAAAVDRLWTAAWEIATRAHLTTKGD